MAATLTFQDGALSVSEDNDKAAASAGERRERKKKEDQDADCKEVSTAEGADTFGVVNRHPNASDHPFTVGVSVDRNKACRRTMEDAHAFIYDFGGIKGQGYFAVFDGHAGKHAAEWCGEHFHEHLLAALLSSPNTPVPDTLNSTFHTVDRHLSDLASKEGKQSGCTAVTVFLRLEDEEGNAVGEGGGVGSAVVPAEEVTEEAQEAAGGSNRGKNTDKMKRKIKDLLSSSSKQGEFTGPSPAEVEEVLAKEEEAAQAQAPVKVLGPAEVKKAAKRTIYTANVGDARAVLARNGKAVRLTYDHKGSDAREAKRITDAGGFVMNNRVNGVLAVTRSLGDSSMKEFVVGSPYTTETTLSSSDSWLVVACDGLWDVCEDQQAVDILKGAKDAQEGSAKLLEHALTNFSSDNLSVLVVDLRAGAGAEAESSSIGVPPAQRGGADEAVVPAQ